MNRVTLKLTIAILLLIAISFVNSTPPDKNSVDLAMKMPPFISLAKAQGADVSFLANEAGISAYAKFSQPINLNGNIRTIFRTIEIETSQYMIGSVPVSGYGATEDVHLYASSDGWLMAYYLADNPLGKIFSLQPYSTTAISTKLEIVLQSASNITGYSISGATYYDFRYPNATNLMLITKQGGSYRVKLPASYEYYARGWALDLGGINWIYGDYLVDNVIINTTGSYVPTYGELTYTQLLPNIYHDIKVYKPFNATDVYGGLAIIYRVQ